MGLFRALSVVALASGLLAAGSACSGDNGSAAPGPASDDGGTSATCVNDPRVRPYAAGLKATSQSGRLVAEIVNATPSPPQRGSGDAGMNVWTMRFTLDSAPVTDPITVGDLMPDHGHSSPRSPHVTVNPDGTQTIDTLFLFMGGVWQISFTSANETATYSLCVE